MNKQTREFLLELKQDYNVSITMPIKDWVEDCDFICEYGDKHNIIANNNFHTACKLMVACGFGDEII